MSLHYQLHKSRKQNRRKNIIGLISFSCLILVGLGFYSRTYTRTEPKLSSDNKQTNIRVISPKKIEQPITKIDNMPWPNYGSAAYVVPKDNILAASIDNSKPVPVASLAKIITALAVLQKKPLKPGEQGPSIKITEQDEEIYRDYVRKSGTVVSVKAGTSLTEYEALEAVLLPSANNIADTLAIWAFGSIDEYTIYANNMVKSMGLEKTIVSDASGYSPSTVSTAREISQLGYRLLKDPVLREIVLQSEATIPFAGSIQSYNTFANKDGMIGIKVGYTEEAGKCYVAGQIRKNKNGVEEIAVVSVLGAEDLQIAARDSRILLNVGNEVHDKLDLLP